MSARTEGLQIGATDQKFSFERQSKIHEELVS